MLEVGVAVVGAGHWGYNIINVLRDLPGVRIQWIIDSDPRRVKEVEGECLALNSGNSVTLALDDPTVSALIVSTPASTHAEIALAALRANKHIFVEKPFALNTRVARSIVSEAKRRGLILLVGHIYLYNEAVRLADSCIRSGELGRIFHISAVRTNFGPCRNDVNAAWDLACHDIAIANWWLRSVPTSVSATGEGWICDGIEDVVTATLHYPEGVMSTVNASWLSPRKVRQLAVVGDRGMLSLDDMDPEPLRIFQRAPVSSSDGQVPPGLIVEGRSVATSTKRRPLSSEIVEFVDAIRGQGELSTTPDSAIDVMRVLDAINESISLHGTECTVD